MQDPADLREMVKIDEVRTGLEVIGPCEYCNDPVRRNEGSIRVRGRVWHFHCYADDPETSVEEI